MFGHGRIDWQSSTRYERRGIVDRASAKRLGTERVVVARQPVLRRNRRVSLLHLARRARVVLRAYRMKGTGQPRWSRTAR